MDEILNPTVFIGGLELREPVTTLTDFLVAIVELIGYIKFSKTIDSYLMLFVELLEHIGKYC